MNSAKLCFNGIVDRDTVAVLRQGVVKAGSPRLQCGKPFSARDSVSFFIFKREDDRVIELSLRLERADFLQALRNELMNGFGFIHFTGCALGIKNVGVPF